MSARFPAAIATLLFSASTHAEDLARYAYAWPLTLDGDSAAWQVELPVEVYAVLQDRRLGDLDIVDGDGNPVPSALRLPDPAGAPIAAYADLPLFAVPAPAPRQTDAPAINLHIERDAEGRLHRLDAGVDSTSPRGAATTATDDFILDASAVRGSLDRLRLDWNDDTATVDARFAISASDDLQRWRTLAADAAVIALNQNGNRLSRHEIPLGGARASYLRLHRLDDGPALPVLRASVRTLTPARTAQSEHYWLAAVPLAGTAPEHVENPSLAKYRYTLPAALPVDGVRVRLASDNSIARVDVASRAGANAGWSPQAALTALRLATGTASAALAINNDDVGLSTLPRDIEWQVTATPRLDHAPTLCLAWRPDRFVFLAQGHGPFRLVAGSATARRAAYPVDVALAELRTRLGHDWQPPLAPLGPRNTLGGNDALAPAPAPVERDWKTVLLWTVLAGAAALIGAMALSLLRKPPAR